MTTFIYLSQVLYHRVRASEKVLNYMFYLHKFVTPRLKLVLGYKYKLWILHPCKLYFLPYLTIISFTGTSALLKINKFGAYIKMKLAWLTLENGSLHKMALGRSFCGPMRCLLWRVGERGREWCLECTIPDFWWL